MSAPARPYIFLCSGKELAELHAELCFLLAAKPLPRFYRSKREGAQRLAIISEDAASFISSIQEAADLAATGASFRFAPGSGIFTGLQQDRPKVMLLFPGFGSEHPAMFDGFFSAFPSLLTYREALGHLLHLVFPESSVEADAMLRDTIGSMPFGKEGSGFIGFLFSLMMWDLLVQCGVCADGFAGHSNGENAALLAAGTLPQTRGVELANFVEKIISGLSIHSEVRGRYWALAGVRGKLIEEAQALFSEGFFLAMDNCPGQQVVYISQEAEQSAVAWLQQRRVIAIPLVTDQCYHTPLFGAQADTLRRFYSSLKVQPLAAPLYSCADAMLFPGDPDGIREQALRQWLMPVRFRDTIKRITDDGFNIFIETGPAGRLTGFVRDCLRQTPVAAFSANETGINGVLSFYRCLAQCWTSGIAVNWEKVLSEPARMKTTPAFESRLWALHEELLSEVSALSERMLLKLQSQYTTEEVRAVRLGLLEGHVRPSSRGLQMSATLDLKRLLFLRDHTFGETLTVVPFTVSLELAAEAASVLGGHKLPLRLEAVRAHAWMAFDTDCIDLEIQIDSLRHSAGHRKTAVFIREGDRLLFEAVVSSGDNGVKAPGRLPPQHQGTSGFQSGSGFANDSLFHGPFFLSLQEVTRISEHELTASLQMPSLTGALNSNDIPDLLLPCTLHDVAGQLVAYWLCHHGAANAAVFPASLQEYCQYAAFPPAGSPLTCLARLRLLDDFVTADFEFLDCKGSLLASLTAFRCRIYQHPAMAQVLLRRPATGIWDQTDTSFWKSAGGIWARILAKDILNREEFGKWRHLEGEASLQALDKAVKTLTKA